MGTSQKHVHLDFGLYILRLPLAALLPADTMVGIFPKKNHLTGPLMEVKLVIDDAIYDTGVTIMGEE